MNDVLDDLAASPPRPMGPDRAPRERQAPAMPPGTSASDVGGRELALYVVALLAVAAFRIALAGGPQFLNDSYQYLSIAEHLGHDGSVSTSFAHFDVERGHGRLPAPSTTFPAGYPTLIALVSLGGVPRHWAALVVSLAAVVAVLPLLRSAARSMGLSANGSRFCLAAWTVNAQASLWGITLYSDATFTALHLAALALLLAHARDERARSWRVVVAFLLVAAAAWVRYAGLFFVVALHLYALVRVARERARWKTWVAAVALCDAAIVALLARNLALTGSWTGGHSRIGSVRHGLGSLLYRAGAAGYELTFGSHQKPLSFPFGALVLLVVAGAAGIVIWRIRTLRGARRLDAFARPAQRSLLLLSLGVYCGALGYLGVASNVSIMSRMFLPVVPVALLLAVAAFSPGEPARAPRLRAIALAALAVGYVGTNASSALPRPAPARHAMVAEMLALPTPGGAPLARWIASAIPGDAVLFAVEGQATGYLLERRTISAVGRLFASATWDEDEVRREMSRFGAEYVIVYPEAVASGSNDGLDSEFLRRLAARRAPPWLELAAENPRVVVYRKVG